MTARTWQALQLAQLLGQRSGLPGIECRWFGSDSSRCGWHLKWTDGPSIEEMRRLVTDAAAEFSALDTTTVRYDRRATALAEATALLLYLDAHPDEAPYANTFTPRAAFDSISYPERSEERWLHRARALLSVRPDATPLSTEVIQTLANRARQDGWHNTLNWLDAITCAANNPAVIDLADARGRRRRRQR